MTSKEPRAVTPFPSCMIDAGFSLRRLAIRPEAFQAILDDVAQIDTRAKKFKPEDSIDRAIFRRDDQERFL